MLVRGCAVPVTTRTMSLNVEQADERNCQPVLN